MKTLLKEIYHYFYPRETDGFIKHIKKRLDPADIKVIFDVGSRDLEQSIELANKFQNAKIVAFECNDDLIPICKEKAKTEPRVRLVTKAVSDQNGTLTFYKINREKSVTSIPSSYRGGREEIYVSGGSSLYPFGYDAATKNENSPEGIYTDKVEVEAITLESFCKENNIEQIDLLWMDLEGAELRALKGLGPLLSTVKMIQTEAQVMKHNDTNMGIFSEIRDYLMSYNFDYLDKDRVHKNIADKEGHTDVVFVNRREVPV